MQHDVESEFLVPLPGSPLQDIDIDVETIPTDGAGHKNILFMEDTVWPHEGKLDEYIEKSGTMYANEFRKQGPDWESKLLRALTGSPLS